MLATQFLSIVLRFFPGSFAYVTGCMAWVIVANIDFAMRADAAFAPGRALVSAHTGSLYLVARTDYCMGWPDNWCDLRPA